MQRVAILIFLGTVCGGIAMGQWADELTLAPTTQPQPEAVADIEWPNAEEFAAKWGLNLDPEPFRVRGTGTGIDLTDVYDDGTAVQVRVPEGVGVGFTTGAAWSISYAVPITGGLSLSVYYLDRIDAVVDDAARIAGAELDAERPERSAGLRLEWDY